MQYSLIIKLEGPMQSWGTEANFDVRPTEQFPTKSGVIGLISAALGRSRVDSVDDLAALKMTVRIDQQGKVERDFQTARIHDVKKNGCISDEIKSRVIYRYYLADAKFTVALESSDLSFLKMIQTALRYPKYPLYLGRRSYPVMGQLVYDIEQGSGEEVLCQNVKNPVLITESEKSGFVRRIRDVPISYNPFYRQYKYRYFQQNIYPMYDAYGAVDTAEETEEG